MEVYDLILDTLFEILFLQPRHRQTFYICAIFGQGSLINYGLPVFQMVSSSTTVFRAPNKMCASKTSFGPVLVMVHHHTIIDRLTPHTLITATIYS